MRAQQQRCCAAPIKLPHRMRRAHTGFNLSAIQ